MTRSDNIESDQSASTRGDEVRSDWRKKYASRLAITDTLVLIWIVFGVQIAWLGIDSEAGVAGGSRGLDVSYVAISLIIVVGWLSMLAFYDTRQDRVIGVGSTEYKLIVNASVRLFGLIAILAFTFKADLARGYIMIAFPLGVLILLFSRWMWRQWLVVQRARGKYVSHVILVGSEQSVIHMARQLARQPGTGFSVAGVCVPDGRLSQRLQGNEIAVCGDLSDVARALGVAGADTVIITSSDELHPDRVRELSWALEPGRHHLVVAPSLTGIAGPRIHTRPVAGFPLIHVETPRYDGRKILAKRAFDICASVALLISLFPVFLLVGLVIWTSSRGPILFRQKRVGVGGEEFTLLKFRTMHVDAEARLNDLQLGGNDQGNGVLFKSKNDPRVFKAGRILRRFSLDELPQLVNVLIGSMSLVGPRPPLPREVALYEPHVHRRFLVKPGITGLWQVSGRSDLSWEDSVQLDLYYVENWSITGDIVILWRTCKAVVSSQGAY